MTSPGYSLPMNHAPLLAEYLADTGMLLGLCNIVFVIKKLHNYLLGATEKKASGRYVGHRVGDEAAVLSGVSAALGAIIYVRRQLLHLCRV